MHGYQLVNRMLTAVGVETVFQYMAEDTMELMADLEANWRDDIEVVHSRHEQGAMAMADAYARSGDRIGVCIVGRGPGVAQTGTALINARNNATPLLVVAPTPATDDPHDPKYFKQELYLESTVGNVVTIESERTLVSLFREALREVHLGDGPLAVQIPKDILNNPVDVPEDDDVDIVLPDTANPDSDAGAAAHAMARSAAAGRLHPDPDAVERTVDVFLDSDAYQPPVILAGEGAAAAGAKDAIEDLAERLSALLVTSLKGRDLFSDHPFALGFSGNWGSPLANEYLSEASFVLAIGCSLNNHTVDEGYLVDEDATVVHVDADPASIGQYTPVDLGIVGDARRTVDALSDAFERADVDREGELWTDSLRERIADYSPLYGDDPREYPERSGAMDPRDLTVALDDALPAARLLGTDGGMFRKWVLDGITASPSDSILSCDFSAIGLGLPMGIGIGQFLKDERRADGDERTAVTVCGDGGFMMSLQELETAVRHEIPVTIVVMNDSSLGAEYHAMKSRGVKADIALMSTPEISAVAEALGAEGHTATNLAEVAALADEMDDPDGPVVVECKVNPEVAHRSY